jgi:SpoVK/Ycf46/Vps4 family AAA+-type ATPase
LKKVENLDTDFLAKQTPGFSGADIANVCNEAALIAARNNKEAVDKQDFLDAVDRIIGGLEKKNKIITPDEKESDCDSRSGSRYCKLDARTCCTAYQSDNCSSWTKFRSRLVSYLRKDKS